MRRGTLVALLALTAMGCGPKGKGSSADPPPTGAPVAIATVANGTTIDYRWSGGFSIYQFYEMVILAKGDETAELTFTVKPVRGDPKTVKDTLDAKQFAELKALFDQVGFDKLGSKERKVRIMDIGQVLIRRTAGGASHEVTTSPNRMVDGDLTPLQMWFDTRIRAYLEKSGAAPKR